MNMNKIINYLKSIGLFFIVLFVYLLLMTTLYYFEVFEYKLVSIINYIASIIMFFLLGFKVSRLEKQKGYLNGFLVSSIVVILFALISLILSKLSFSSLVYYLSVILSSIVGGIIGVSKDKN